MSRNGNDLLFEVSPGEIRAALLDRNGQLVSVQVERLGDTTLTGAIWLGRVTGIDKAIGAAFIDIGAGEPGFLGKARGLTEGAAVIVQTLRPAGGGKGPALTAMPVLSGRYVALDPMRTGLNIPRSLTAHAEQIEARLGPLVPDGMGLIARGNTLEVEIATLEAEIERLCNLWDGLKRRAQTEKAPTVLHAAPDLIERMLLDASGRIVIDEPNTFTRIKGLVTKTMPDLAGTLELYKGDIPLFEAAEVEEQLEAALSAVVSVKGGGSLVIEQTEALTAIDVNMGGAGGRMQNEAAILKTNLAAADAAARQIRLRNIAGLIVIDFVSMRNKGNRRKVVDAMRRAMRGDRVKSDVLGMTPAGLVEITRQRVGPSLGDRFLSRPERSAALLPEAVACAALRAVLRHGGTGPVSLTAAPAVIAVLHDALAEAVDKTVRRLGRPLDLRAEPGRAGFDIASGGRS